MIAVLFSCISIATSQIVGQAGSTSIEMVPTNTIQPCVDTSYSNSPATFLSVVTGNNNIYTLSSSNLVEVYSKAHPNILYQTFRTYSFANIHPYVFVQASVDPQ
jgi:hypothetical protein